MSAELTHALQFAESALRGADAQSAIVLGAALRRVLDALSSPPADDVREALARLIADGAAHPMFPRPVGVHPFERDYRGADAILAAFEVRPYGTVTDTEHDRDGALICRKCGQGLTALDVVDGEKPCPGAHGTVNDTEVEWEYGVRHVAVDGWPTDRAHESLEGARADLATCGWNCFVIRRRAAQEAGKWEPLDAERGPARDLRGNGP